MKRKRLDANLTQQGLARKLHRPQSFVAKYENGERRLDLLEFIEIADAIGFDPGQFIIEFRELQQDIR
ncbi:MAG: helix-turn-helix transcriptional regulator [Acidobacteria bacterium]|nr:helix-turn-helix transcriptional regulator [Acidobacteriota bacterium]